MSMGCLPSYKMYCNVLGIDKVMPLYSHIGRTYIYTHTQTDRQTQILNKIVSQPLRGSINYFLHFERELKLTLTNVYIQDISRSCLSHNKLTIMH